ncbi:MAG: trypsin-like peptidase domain-containing protein [Candidatus Altimarinota bacterium]
MKKVLISLISILAFTAASWGPIADRVSKSILPVEGANGGCTGFVINSDQKYVLTAAHCDMSPASPTYVDKLPAKIEFKDTKTDLMVLFAEKLDRPALKIATSNPDIAEEVASHGFGFSLNKPLFRLAHISAEDVRIPGTENDFLVTDANFISGQSGGPVVDANGEVVMIVQLGASQGMGAGVGAETIRRSVRRFLPEERP